MLGDDGLRPDVVQQETAGAVGILGGPGLEAFLPDQRGRLVAQAASDAPAFQRARFELAERMRTRGAHDLGHVHFVEVELVGEEVDQLLVVLELVDVHEHGPARVGGIGDEDVVAHAIELVDEPGVDRAEGQSAGLVCLAHALLVLQQPQQLGDGWVGRDGQAADVGELVAAGPRLQLSRQRRSSCVCPDDGIVQRLSGLAIPAYGRLALVGDANGFYALFRVAVFLKNLYRAFDTVVYGLDNLIRVMLMPA